MGISYHTYLGPYLVCIAEEQKTDKILRSCPNSACESYGQEYAKNGLSFNSDGTKFCPSCGSSVANVTIPAKAVNVDTWSLREKIKEKLTTISIEPEDKTRHIWLPNIYEGPAGIMIFNREEASEVKIGNSQINDDLTWLLKTFEKEIKQLREAYGDSKVSYYWGLIRYTM